MGERRAVSKSSLAVIAVAGLIGSALLALLADGRDSSNCELRVIPYDLTRYPHIDCLAGRVLAETRPELSARERQALWRAYGVRPSFEWLVPETGFTYHELEVMPYQPWRRAWAAVTQQKLLPRKLPPLVCARSDHEP